jgi:hypothetical protein
VRSTIEIYHRRRARRRFAAAVWLIGWCCSGSTLAADSESARGPDVTIIAGESRTIYEYRQAGQLRIVKIVPKHGRPYYLAPVDETRGGGDLEQASMLVPRWVIVEF